MYKQAFGAEHKESDVGFLLDFSNEFRSRPPKLTTLPPPPIFLGITGHQKYIKLARFGLMNCLQPDKIVAGCPVCRLCRIHVSGWDLGSRAPPRLRNGL